ncbi:MAG TPA: glycosyltransferase, partial [Candidatus Limnocylindria bacterium]
MSAQAGPRPADRLRAVHVISNLERGGAQEVVRTLAAALPERGCDPLVVALRDGPLRAELEAVGIPVRLVPGRAHSLLAVHRSIPEIIRLRRQLRAAADGLRADVVQTHLLGALDFLVLTLKRPGRAVFWTVHNSQLELRADQVPGARWLLR